MRRPELFVELNNDPQTDQHVLLVVHLQQLEGQGQNVLSEGSEEVIGWESLDHLQHQLPHLLDVELRYVVSCPLLQT